MEKSNCTPTERLKRQSVLARFYLGVSAWHDLAVYLIARFFWYQHAVETAKVFLNSGHSEGQSPYAVMTRPMESADGPMMTPLLSGGSSNAMLDNRPQCIGRNSSAFLKLPSRSKRSKFGIF